MLSVMSGYIYVSILTYLCWTVHFLLDIFMCVCVCVKAMKRDNMKRKTNKATLKLDSECCNKRYHRILYCHYLAQTVKFLFLYIF